MINLGWLRVWALGWGRCRFGDKSDRNCDRLIVNTIRPRTELHESGKVGPGLVQLYPGRP
ncbi:hypothetical protein HanPI659440_Chr15g0601041 [Helianthus annuus]|nr:hypothetical protein HanPI659440_Chr15g0601041 [Helianthus annuus]